MLKPTPYRKKQVISFSLLILSGAALIGLEVFSHPFLSNSYKILLVHAFEGSFIGGLCDWFAVWKTYHAIENDSETVADEIGKWVASDLINEHTIRKQIDEILDSPETMAEIFKLLDTYLDSPEKTKQYLEEIWLSLEKFAVEFIVNYNFSLKEMTLITSAASDEIVLNTVKICVGDTMLRMSEEEKFKTIVNKVINDQNVVTRVMGFFLNIPELVRRYGEKLKAGDAKFSGDEKYLDEIITIISLSADKYILSWESLPLEHKRLAVEALFFQLREVSLGSLSRFLVKYKNSIRDYKTLRDYEPLKDFYALIESKIDDNVPKLIGEKISERLKSQDPKDFRMQLEWKTRKILENIRINGTLLGFALGLMLGILKIIY